MPNFHALKEGRTIVEVSVKDNNVEGALRILKKKMQREGIFKEMKMRSFFEKPSQKKLIVNIYKDLIIPSTIFFASENNIIVFSR